MTGQCAGALAPDDYEKLGWMIEHAAKQSAKAQVAQCGMLDDSWQCHTAACGVRPQHLATTAQGLRAPITSAAKLQAQSQTLYLSVQRLTGDRCPCYMALWMCTRQSAVLHWQGPLPCSHACSPANGHPMCMLEVWGMAW